MKKLFFILVFFTISCEKDPLSDVKNLQGTYQFVHSEIGLVHFEAIYLSTPSHKPGDLVQSNFTVHLITDGYETYSFDATGNYLGYPNTVSPHGYIRCDIDYPTNYFELNQTFTTTFKIIWNDLFGQDVFEYNGPVTKIK